MSFARHLAVFFILIPLPALVADAESVSRVGINTDRLQAHSPASPTIDAVKSSSPFGSVGNPGDGNAPVDANGWPTSDFAVVVIDQVAGTEGVYKLSCRGKADIGATWGNAVVRNIVYDAAGGVTSADVEHRGGVLALTFKNTDHGVRDLRILRPGYQSDAKVFTDEYLRSKEPFGIVRLMNWTRTNDSKTAKWDERCKPSDAQWSRNGGPWEPWLDYAAKAHKDLWLCIPHLADDAYVEQLASLCRDRLGNVPVRLYVEHSNEVWNWQFAQAKYADATARALVAANKGSLLNVPAVGDSMWRHRYHAQRTIEIGAIFKRVFGAGDQRIRPVLATSVDPAAAADVLPWIERHYGPPKQQIVGIAIAPYFGNRSAVVMRNDLTAAEVATHLLTVARDYVAGTGQTSAAVAQHVTLVRKYGLMLTAYEGGADLGSGTNSLDAKAAAQLLDGTGDAVAIYLDWWFQRAGPDTIFCYYKDFSRWDKSGIFGLSDRPDRLSVPKYRAAAAAAAKYAEGRGDATGTPPTTQPTTVPAPTDPPPSDPPSTPTTSSVDGRVAKAREALRAQQAYLRMAEEKRVEAEDALKN